MEKLIKHLIESPINYKDARECLNFSAILAYRICRQNPDFLDIFDLSPYIDTLNLSVKMLKEHRYMSGNCEIGAVGSHIIIYKNGFDLVYTIKEFDGLIPKILIYMCQAYMELYNDNPNFLCVELPKIIKIFESGDYHLGLQLLCGLQKQIENEE
jgi:hypothetical protein